MSIEAYNKAINVINNNREQCFFAGNKSESLISKSENILELKFSKQYRNFLLNYGAGSIGSEEIYGIIDEDFYNSTIPDAIWFTITEREEAHMPKNLLVIYDTGGDEVFCLDFDKININGEPEVVAFVPGLDLKYQNYERIAEDFGDFLLDRVIEGIASI